jgi:hypothetical protein
LRAPGHPTNPNSVCSTSEYKNNNAASA